MHSYLAPTVLLALRDMVPTGSAISHFSLLNSLSIFVLNFIAFSLSSFFVSFMRWGTKVWLTTSRLSEEGLTMIGATFLAAFACYFFWTLV
jgi:hypothetical protein